MIDDLITRQSVINEITRFRGYLDDDMIFRLQTAIKRLPTVDAIPIDFITEFKEDYCDAKSDKCDIGIANALVELMLCWEDEQEGIEWRNDHERIPSKQQSVEAIPMEWIMKYYEYHPASFVCGMIYDWAIEQAERKEE